MRSSLLLATLSLALAGCAPADATRPRNALLITLDTTRADALGCYGGPAGLTPALDALSREGLTFERAWTVAPLTLPSHASMLTGLYPPRHGLRDNGLAALPAAASTLAERARARGYQTAAFVAATALDRAFALDQGFDVYAEPRTLAGGRSPAGYLELAAPSIRGAALAWLERRDRTRPFLLWAHFFDPHTPYAPPPAQLARAGGDAYLGEVAAMDAAVGELVGALRREGLLDETVVLVIADHGEALGEHGEPTHGALCYEPTLRIPFLIRFPDGRRAGERSRAAVSAVDVFPTLLEALELGPPGEVDGRSLWSGEPEAGRGVYFESYSGFLNFGWSPLAGWTDGELKYLASSEPELYAPEADPGEARNLVAERGADVARARAAMAELLRAPPLSADDGRAIPEELLRDLRQLGYGATGGAQEALPHPLEPSHLPSPRARAVELVPLDLANQHLADGRFEQAIAELRALERGNPRNALVLDLLTYALMQVGGHAEAVGLLEQRLTLGVPRCDTLTSLATCLELTGDEERALAEYRRALAIDGDFAPALAGCARLLLRQGREAEARPHLERLRALEGR